MLEEANHYVVNSTSLERALSDLRVPRVLNPSSPRAITEAPFAPNHKPTRDNGLTVEMASVMLEMNRTREGMEAMLHDISELRAKSQLSTECECLNAYHKVLKYRNKHKLRLTHCF